MGILVVAVVVEAVALGEYVMREDCGETTWGGVSQDMLHPHGGRTSDKLEVLKTSLHVGCRKESGRGRGLCCKRCHIRGDIKRGARETQLDVGALG